MPPISPYEGQTDRVGATRDGRRTDYGGRTVCVGRKSRPSTMRPVPDDFAAVAPTMGKTALAAHYGCARQVARRWLAETGITAATVTLDTKKPTPADLPELAKSMGRNALSRHYGLSYNTITRMLAGAGIEAFTPAPTPRPASTGYRKLSGAKKRTHIGANHLIRDASTEGQAADVLRRDAAVYRCNERGGVPDCRKQLTHWRYGATVLTGDELIERARRKGFDPDAWRRIGFAIAGHEHDNSRREQHG